MFTKRGTVAPSISKGLGSRALNRPSNIPSSMSDSLATLAHANRPTDITDSLSALSSSTTPLKRRASTSFECPDDNSRKRMKEDMEDMPYPAGENILESNARFANQLAEELQCGCCSELVYRPVLVMPCQHFFCGRCVRFFLALRSAMELSCADSLRLI